MKFVTIIGNETETNEDTFVTNDIDNNDTSLINESQDFLVSNKSYCFCIKSRML